VNRIRGRYCNRDEEKQRIEMKRSREKFCSAEEEENVYVYIRIEMKTTRERFCSAGEKENVYVYILLLELNNLKLRSSRYF